MEPQTLSLEDCTGMRTMMTTTADDVSYDDFDGGDEE